MFLKLLESHIKTGQLHLYLPDGSHHHFGNSGEEAHWYIRSEKAMYRIARYWEFETGQTFMEEAWDTPDLRTLLSVLRTNFKLHISRNWSTSFLNILKRAHQISNSYSNVAHHYDVKEEVFRLFLDREMFYSCAYFNQPDVTLEQAQKDKAAHIARKLLLEPGMKVLDIGCGWGSLAFHLATCHKVSVTGITLSREQLKVAQEEAAKRGLDNLDFVLSDYREHKGSYDRVVSVGMLEHVGAEYIPLYFQRVQDLLNTDGVALIHTIGNSATPAKTNPWIEKYIFPGGLIPTLSELATSIEKSGLITTDVESLRLHYAYTLSHWYRRFMEHRDTIRELMNADGRGESFCRMWEFYLAACESAFLRDNLVVYQCQLARRHALVPVTRDYLYR